MQQQMRPPVDGMGVPGPEPVAEAPKPEDEAARKMEQMQINEPKAAEPTKEAAAEKPVESAPAAEAAKPAAAPTMAAIVAGAAVGTAAANGRSEGTFVSSA